MFKTKEKEVEQDLEKEEIKLENLDLTDFFKSISFKKFDVDETVDSPFLKEKQINDIFGCKVIYITSSLKKQRSKATNALEEESVVDFNEKEVETDFFFVICARFKDHKEHAEFRNMFKDFFTPSKKSYLFWASVKVQFNQNLAEKKQAEIKKIMEETLDIEKFF